MAQVLVIANRDEAVIQAGQPSAQMAAWWVDVPTGQTGLSAAAAFVSASTFQIGTEAYVLDPSLVTDPNALTHWKLDASWTKVG